MDPADLESLVEKVRALAQGPQADLLRKFVDLLYKPVRGRAGQSQATKAGRSSGVRTRTGPDHN